MRALSTLALAVLLAPAATSSAAASAGEPITLTDLVRRAQFPMAALSPDGRYVAFAVVRGNAVDDTYELSIRVTDTNGKSRDSTVHEFTLAPNDAYDQLHWLNAGAADMRWIGAEDLLFTAGGRGQMQLAIWNVRTRTSRMLLEQKRWIQIEHLGGRENDVSVVSTELVTPASLGGEPPDRAWRMRDGYSFRAALKNPKTGARVRRQSWMVSADTEPHIRAGQAAAVEDWESTPAESPSWEGVQRGATQSFALHETPSSDGKIVAAVEYRMSNVGLPDSTESFRIVTREGSDTRVLVPDTRPFVIVWTAIIAWGKQDKSLYYLDTRPDSTTLYNITLDGKRTKRWTQPSLFAKPCPPLRECQFTTPGGRFALLVRSSNTHPGELVRVDLESGAILPLTTENDRFVHTPHPEVRFYRVENVEGDAWGRLYLPLSYERGRRYPVVFTQYVSSPGFGSDIGDEVPFMPLTAAGIAVFDMNSNSLAAQGNPGDVDTYVQRVQRPMKGMQWIARKLADEGIVDANRIGLAGLSYGAEIALYSWWNWKALRAVSVASAAWDPQLFYLGGPGYVSSVFNQGLPVPEENTMAAWRRVTAGMHARSDSTPLLIQSGDEEENFTVPAWSRMRQVGAPVEWLEYPQEGHAKVHPAARWWVYQRNLDWFRFWLQDEENVSARKPDHYERWRAMRDARNASH